MTSIDRVACIGGGVIGAGWAARFVLNGIDVRLFDPDAQAERKVREVLANAERAYERMVGSVRPTMGHVELVDSIEAAVDGAVFVQESVPERLDLKRKVLAEIDAALPAAVPIGSSTSGLKPSDMQRGVSAPERVLVGHPYNPVYLLPLVEIVAGDLTSAESVEKAREIYQHVGMHPVTIAKEIEAFVGDRLLEAMWREALWLVRDGIATVSDIDDVIRYAFGLRFAQMGLFQVYRVAGGEAGMRHFMAQFGPCLSWPWTKLMDVPELTDELVETIASQSDNQAGDLGIRDLERIRDDNLVDIMHALEAGPDRAGWGAGELLTRYRARLAARGRSDGDPSALLQTAACNVPDEWIDYNGHMTEHRFVQVFGDATDALLAAIGVDAEYLGGGHSYYTVETHVRHLAEAASGDALSVQTQLIGHDDKRIQIFHSMHDDTTGNVLATSEQLLLHVDSDAGRAMPAAPHILEALADIAETQRAIPLPAAAGRRVGDRPVA